MAPRPRLVIGAAVGLVAATAAYLASRSRVDAPVDPPVSSATLTASATTAPPPAPVARGDAGSGDAIDPELTTIEGEDSFRLLVFTVFLERARARVIDVAMRRELSPFAEELDATFVVNGGYFDPKHEPDGLVISEGRELAKLRPSMGGGVLRIAAGRASIEATETFAIDAAPIDLAIQSKPRLVVKSARNVRGDGGPEAERTAVCVRERGRVLEIVVARGEKAGSGPTLGLFADMLASRGCEDALNLDGGPSTGIAWRSKSERSIVELQPRAGIRHAVAFWATSADAL